MAVDTERPPLRDILTQIAHFLDDIGYSRTLNALVLEAEPDIVVDARRWSKTASLHEMWRVWKRAKGEHPTVADFSSDSSGSDDSDSDEESTGDDSSDDSSDEDGDDDSSSSSGAEIMKASAKRKREATPDSSSEQESSEDSSSDSSDSSVGDSSSDESSSDEDEPVAKRAKLDVSSSASSEDGSSDDSSADSDDSSSSDSDSASSSSASLPPKKKAKSIAAPSSDANDSGSSHTLSNSPTKPAAQTEQDLLVPASALDSSAHPTSEETGMHPDRLKRMPSSTDPKQQNTPASMKRIPATIENVEKLKKSNVPFSRIPKDTYVDPKFASNEYVSYDYADRAYQDLVVTKGKGFTKEKNKKKRGAYRGGTIDLTPKGIKFED